MTSRLVPAQVHVLLPFILLLLCTGAYSQGGQVCKTLDLPVHAGECPLLLLLLLLLRHPLKR